MTSEDLEGDRRGKRLGLLFFFLSFFLYLGFLLSLLYALLYYRWNCRSILHFINLLHFSSAIGNMHVLPFSLTMTVFSSILGTAAASTVWRRSNDGNPAASEYTDAETNITFLGYSTSTGFQFGMVLPSSPTTDLVVQLVSPLKDGGGWGSVDFGSEMTGYLMIVAWPDTSSKAEAVKVSPRIATGYEVSNGANVYSASNITITQIPSGTFVNDTHVAATFVCGGCVNADSFKSSVSKGSATFSYAYALTAVADPGDVDTQLSDHTLLGELYGPFDVALASAESSEYERWVELTGTATAGATGSAVSASTAPVATGSSTSGSSGSGSSASSSSSSSSSSSASSSSEEDDTGFSAGAVFALVGLGFVYVLQAVQII